MTVAYLIFGDAFFTVLAEEFLGITGQFVFAAVDLFIGLIPAVEVPVADLVLGDADPVLAALMIIFLTLAVI